MPVQQIFSAKALVGVWRNLRNTRDQNDLYLTLQYHQGDARGSKGTKYGKKSVIETTSELEDGKTVDVGGKSISFVVPWRSMQAQRRELREKEKELAEALVMLAGEVSFTGMRPPCPSVYNTSQYVGRIRLIYTQTFLRPYRPPSRITLSCRSVIWPLASVARCLGSRSRWQTTRPFRTGKTSIPVEK